MQFLRKLPGYRRHPYGLEVKILKRTPKAFFYSTIITAIFATVAHQYPPGDATEKYFQTVNIMALASLITIWTAIFTVAIGAFVVYVMKGPAYVADPLELSDSESPKK